MVIDMRNIVKKEKNKDKTSKAQLSEAVGFTILVITVTFLIIIYRIFIASGSFESLGVISERHETERLKAGTNALFLMSDEKSGTSMLNLVGIAAQLRNDKIYFGPTIGTVDVSQELIWRMDALFEKDHWRIVVPFPNKTADVQIVIVIDTSGSMKDDIDDVRENLPRIIKELKDAGINVEATVYLLPGGPYGNCSDFPAELMRCKSMEQLNCDLDISGGDPSSTSENWGDGIACASLWGPGGNGWQQGAARVGIMISDELSGSTGCASDQNGACDVSNCVDGWQSVQNGRQGALNNQVTVFGLKAVNDECHNRIIEWMNYIAEPTGGTTYELKEASEVSKTIKDIIVTVYPPDSLSRIDVGSAPPRNIRIRAYDILVPLPVPGEFVKAFIYQWP